MERAFQEFPALKQAGLKVAGFWPFTTEVQIRSLLLELRQNQSEVYLPRFEVSQPDLNFHKWSGSDTGETDPAVFTDVHQLDWILVPGLLFGNQGQRLGRGKGFYDRFLDRVPRAKKLSLCFDEQVFDLPGQGVQDEPFPEESWDQRVDAWISDTRKFP